MISSHEVRWFLDGGIEEHPELKRWVENGRESPLWSGRLGGKPDVYLLIPNAIDMGLKWREEQLQFKGLESALGTQQFNGGHAGNVERWMKWSYEGPAVEAAFGQWFTGAKAIEVFKTRCLRRFRLNPFTHAPAEVDTAELLDRGAALEVTNLRAAGRAFCSVAFEAFPSDAGMHEDFTVLVNETLEKLKGPRLTAAQSMSYPAWLQGLE